MHTVLADAGGVDLAVLGQYGVLGVVAAMLLLYARGSVQRERDRADRLEAENQRLNSLIADRAIPALMAASKAAEESASLLSAIQREREQEALMTRLGRKADQ